MIMPREPSPFLYPCSTLAFRYVLINFLSLIEFNTSQIRHTFSLPTPFLKFIFCYWWSRPGGRCGSEVIILFYCRFSPDNPEMPLLCKQHGGLFACIHQ